jgi:hypothetical protein
MGATLGARRAQLRSASVSLGTKQPGRPASAIRAHEDGFGGGRNRDELIRATPFKVAHSIPDS